VGKKPRASSKLPVIETERLLLRPHRLEDFEDCVAMWSNPVVTRYIGGKPSTREETWSRLLRYAGHWALLGYGYWAIEEKSFNRYIGEAGFADFKRDITPSLNGDPEIGWALAPAAHGKGYATEILQGLLDWGDAKLKSKTTACLIHPDNSPSIYVAKKFGYSEFARTNYKGQPTILFRRRAVQKSK
jgi:RimJ/RimL family protein N-acetyltransferase